MVWLTLVVVPSLHIRSTFIGSFSSLFNFYLWNTPNQRFLDGGGKWKNGKRWDILRLGTSLAHQAGVLTFCFFFLFHEFAVHFALLQRIASLFSSYGLLVSFAFFSFAFLIFFITETDDTHTCIHSHATDENIYSAAGQTDCWEENWVRARWL